MDELDSKIIQLMMRNARMPVKEIAKQVNLTSPAVSSRIHRMEQEGIIGGYTVRLHHPGENNRVQALISIQTAISERDNFLKRSFAALVTLIGLVLIYDGLSDLWIIHRLSRMVRDLERDLNGDIIETRGRDLDE